MNRFCHIIAQTLLELFFLPVFQFLKYPVFEVHLPPYLHFLLCRAQRTLNVAHRRLFLFWKTVLFVHILSLSMRFAYFSHLFNFYRKNAITLPLLFEQYSTSVDPFLGFIVSHTALFNSYSTPALGVSIPLEFYADYAITFRMDLHLLCLLPSIVCRKEKRNRGKGGFIPKTLVKFKKNFRELWIKNSRKTLTGWIRVKLLYPSSASELAVTLDWLVSTLSAVLFIFTLFGIVFFLTVVFISTGNSTSLPLSLLVTTSMDGVVAGYAFWNAVRISLIGIAFTLLISVDSHHQLKASLEKVKACLEKKKTVLRKEGCQQKRRSNQPLLFTHLRSYLSRWLVNFRLAVHHNQSLMSQMLLVIFVLSTVSSLVMVAMLVYERALSSMERVCLAVFLVLQTVLVAAIVQMAIRMPAKLYSGSSELILQAQKSLFWNADREWSVKSKRIFSQHLKLHSMYELVHTTKPFCYTVGAVGLISPSSLQKVCRRRLLMKASTLFVFVFCTLQTVSCWLL